MFSNDKKIIAVIGPTCTGKSELSTYLAEVLHGEIINADSMQVYKHFDIGTAKPDIALRNKISHHLINVVEPFEEFNAAIFKERADESIQEIWSRKKTPILVGGTGLYIKALVYDLFKIQKDTHLRESLKQSYVDNPLGLYEKLKEIDPAYTLKISHRDKIRVVRALEVFYLTGKRMSEWENVHGFKKAKYNVLKIGLKRARNELYQSIDRRVEEMLTRGWVEEVRTLLSMGYKEDAKPFSSIGYREILLYIKGFIRYEDMVKDIKKYTRHYAKRQCTWFSKEKDVWWFQYPEDKEAIIRKAEDFLKRWN
jgi:tRNA dimethylallyltransferase